jgi:hypothetical protein
MTQQQPGQQSGAAPQYSPDGQWWWDGRQWIPTLGHRAPLPTQPQRRPTVNRVLWAIVAVVFFVPLALAGMFALIWLIWSHGG